MEAFKAGTAPGEANAPSQDESVPFTFVAEDLVYPAPVGAVGDQYIFYIGFDPTLAAPEAKPKPVKKKK